MAEKEPIKAKVWKECGICYGDGYCSEDYDPYSRGFQPLCMGCDGSGGYYEKFVVTPTGVIPKLDT